jgi:hypothetical protein
VYDKIVAGTIRLADISQMESPSQFVDQNSDMSRFGTDHSDGGNSMSINRRIIGWDAIDQRRGTSGRGQSPISPNSVRETRRMPDNKTNHPFSGL